MEKVQNTYPTYNNLLIVQDLWQTHYQILSIIIDKKCETYGIKYKYCDCFLEFTNFKNDLIEYKCLCCKKNYQQKFDEKLKERFFLIHTIFLITTIIILFYCFKTVFILMNIWMIEKNSMKHHYLEKKTFKST